MFYDKKSITVKLVGSDLVAAFNCADPALIWKFDLDRNHSFAITLQGEENDWELGVTSPKGEFYPVAHFPVREDAEEAMHKVKKVLMKNKHSMARSLIKCAVGLIVLLAILFVGGNYLLHLAFSGVNPMASAAGMMRGRAASHVTPPPASPVEVPNGVPVTADDVLTPPPH